MADEEPVGAKDRATIRLLDAADSLFYALVGVAFLVAAGITLVYSVVNLIAGLAAAVGGRASASNDVAQTVLNFVSDLLLVLIILEVLGTVRSYLDTHTNSVQPFLFIGIISATRGILSIGARLSIAASGGKSLSGPDFRDAMIELGVNALVIIALGVTLRILGRFATGAVERGGSAQRDPEGEP